MKKLPLILLFILGICYSQDNSITINHKYYTVYYDTILKIPIQTTYTYSYKNVESNYKRTTFTIDKSIP